MSTKNKIIINNIIFSFAILIEIAVCSYEQLASTNFQLLIENNTAYQQFQYCSQQVCSQYQVNDTQYLLDYQYFYSCTQSTYSCSQVTDFQIFYGFCLETCYYNVTAKFISSYFNDYIKCQKQCLITVQSKIIFTNENQTINYPFYEQYLKCYYLNCSNIIVENANQQNFQIYRQIFLTCYTNQIACQTAISYYNVTQIQIYCYNSCIAFIDNNQSNVISDSDLTNLLNCDNSCLNQTIDYETYYLQQAQYEINGVSSSLSDSLRVVTVTFWAILGLGSFILCFITIFITYHMRIFSKMQTYKYEAKYTDSDEEDDQSQDIFIQENKDQDAEDEDENDENQQKNNDQYADIKGYQIQSMVKRSVLQDYIQDGIRKLKSADEEGVGKRTKFNKRSKVTLVDDNIMIEIQENQSNSGQAIDDDYIEQAQNKIKKQEEMNTYSCQQEIHNEQDNEAENSIHYDFARDKSKNVSMTLNSHKNLKEKPQNNWRDQKFQNSEFQESQRNRKQKNSVQENSPSPPHMLNSQKNSKISQQSNKSGKNKMNQKVEMNLEMQDYGKPSKKNNSPKEQKQSTQILPSLPQIVNKIDFDKLFQQHQKEETEEQNSQQVVTQIEDQEKVKSKGLSDNHQQETNNQVEKRRRQRRSIISPTQTPNQIKSNQIYSDICFEQSPQSQTNKQIIQNQIQYQSKSDQIQFNQILNLLKKKSNQGQQRQDNIDSNRQFNKDDNFEINSPGMFNQQNHFAIPQFITDSVYQYQQQHKRSIASKSNQIPSSQTVDESRFISSSNQQDLLSQRQQNNQEKINSISSQQQIQTTQDQQISSSKQINN
ncbi:hypothetical protein ABPG72_011274 [Tetrahymena utriculariae]